MWTDWWQARTQWGATPGPALHCTLAGQVHGLAMGRGQQEVESLLLAGRQMAVGLGDVAEPGLAADDRDRHVGQPGEIARQIAHIAQAVFDLPVFADQRRDLLPVVMFTPPLSLYRPSGVQELNLQALGPLGLATRPRGHPR